MPRRLAEYLRSVPSFRLVAAVSVSLVSPALAGCSSTSPRKALNTPLPTQPSTSIGTSPIAPGTTSPTSAPASPTSSAGVALCTVENLKGSFAVVPGSASAGHIAARVVLTDSSGAVCRTFGYVGMQLLDANGAPVPTDVVREPGTVQTITLAPGQSASAIAQFSPDIAGQGDSTTGTCQPTAQSTEITPPNDTRFMVVQGPGQPVCERGTLDLRPLQPGATAGP
jgi:hypothetical protein